MGFSVGVSAHVAAITTFEVDLGLLHHGDFALFLFMNHHLGALVSALQVLAAAS